MPTMSENCWVESFQQNSIVFDDFPLFTIAVQSIHHSQIVFFKNISPLLDYSPLLVTTPTEFNMFSYGYGSIPIEIHF